MVNICQNYIGLFNMFLDPQCTVSKEDFQHKILNWSTLLPLLVPTYKWGRKEGAETMRIVYKSRSTRLELVHEKYLF